MNHNTQNLASSINTNSQSSASQKRRMLSILFTTLSCLIMIGNFANAETYYLDANVAGGNNDGTSWANAWSSLDSAYTWSTPAVVQEGDTVLFKTGNYGIFSENTNINQSYLFYRSDWVTYKADTGQTPVLDSIIIRNLDKWGGAGNGNSYLIFDGFTASSSVATVEIYNTSYIQVLNCDLQTQPEAITGYYQPYYLSNTSVIISTDSHHVTIQDNEIHNGYRGISTSNGTNWTISGNEIHHFSEDGISALVNTLVIEDNHIYDLRRFTTVISLYGTKSGDFNVGETVTMPGTAAQGIVHNWHVSGYLQVYSTTEYTFWDGWRADNNRTLIGSSSGETLTITLADSTHTDGFQIHGTADGVIIRKNHIDRRRVDGIGSEDGQGFKLWSNVTNVTIENNLIDTIKPAIIEGVSILNMNNNTFYGSSGFQFFGSSGNTVVTNMYNNLMERLVYVDAIGGTSVNIVNHGNNIFDVNPNGQTGDNPFVLNGTEAVNASFIDMFTNVASSDFTIPRTSTAVGFADPTKATATDILGATRNAPPDAGAYEYTGPTANAGADQLNIQDTGSNGVESVTLDGSGSTDQGSAIVSWVWTDSLGDNIADIASPTPDLSVGIHTITLTVTDGDGYSDSDTVTVIVIDFSLTTSSDANGSVTTPGEGLFPYANGNVVNIVADPDSLYEFASWTGTAVDNGKVADPTNESTTVTMDANYTLVANFTLMPTLNITSGAGGDVTTPGEALYSYNDGDTPNLAVTATPDAGYRFDNWGGTATAADTNPTTVTDTFNLGDELTLTANFQEVKTITYSSTGPGSVTTPGEGADTQDSGDPLAIVATRTSDDDYFINWTGTGVAAVADTTAASTTVTYSGDYTLIANFGVDLTAPTVTSTDPANNATQVPTNALAIVTISDAGTGVAPATVTIVVTTPSDTDVTVYTGDITEYTSALGKCRRAGTKTAYTYYFQPSPDFEAEYLITVKVNASDLQTPTSNDMAEYTFSFHTAMPLFGDNAMVNSSPTTAAANADTATTADGVIWAVWDQPQASGRSDVYIGELALGGDAFAASVNLSDDSINDQTNPVIAASTNDLYIVWEESDPNGLSDILVYYTSAGDWAGPVKITDPNNTSDQTLPAIAIDAAGTPNIYVTYQDNRDDSDEDIYVATSTDGATWTETKVADAATSVTKPAIAIDSANTAYIAWVEDNNIKAASSAAWGTPVTLVDNASLLTNPAIAAEGAGTKLHLLWDDGADVFHAVTTGGLAGVTITGDITDDSNASAQTQPTIAVNGTKVLAAWKDARNGDTDIYYAEKGNSTFTSNTQVNDDSGTSAQSAPVIALDDNSKPYLAWTDSRTTKNSIYYSGATSIGAALVSTPVAANAAATVTSGSISVAIPINELPAPTTITIAEFVNPPDTPADTFGTFYEFGPSGLTFTAPATITIPHAAADCPGYATWRVYWYDLSDGTWKTTGISGVTHSAAGDPHTVAFNTTHFSAFGVGGAAAAVDGGDGGGGGGGGCSMSPYGQGSILEFLLPYAVMILAVTLLRLRRKA